MTREEYIKDLVSQNITGREIVELASQFENEEEEVKTEVVADQAGAAVTTTTNEASDTASQSGNGSSGSQPAIKPGQTITRNDGYEYKFELNPEDNSQGIYYSRKAGSNSEWINANKNTSSEGQVAKASIANLFGHSDFDDAKREEYFKAIEDQKKYNEDLKKKKAEAVKQRLISDKKGIVGTLKGDDDAFFGNFGFGEDKEFSWQALSKDFSDLKFTEAGAKIVGEGVEALLDTKNDAVSKGFLEPIAGALNFIGVMDFSDFEDDSWDGVNFDNTINNIITKYALDEGATPSAYGEAYDFAEEAGDQIESTTLNIAANIMALPKIIADTKKVIGDTVGNILPEGAQEFLNNPVIKTSLLAAYPGLVGIELLSQKDLVEAGEIAYDNFSEKSEQLNLTLMDFGNEGMVETGWKGITGQKNKKDAQGNDILGEDGKPIKIDLTPEQRVGAFVTGAARTTSAALGSLPSVAQSMIPYVGIASIVAGEAAAANMESAKDGRPLDWARLGHASVVGAAEGLLEITTKRIGGKMFKNLRGGPQDKVKKSLLKYGTEVAKDFGAEGLSETGTLLLTQAADYLYKDEVENFLPTFSQVLDTFMIGGLMGGGMASVGAGASIIRNTIGYKNIKSNLKETNYKDLSSMFDPAGTVDAGTTTNTTVENQPSTQTQAESQVDKSTEQPSSNKSSKTLKESSKIENEVAFMDKQTENDAVKKNKNQVETKPRVTNATLDQQADNAHNVLQHPQTEMFLNTELKRKVDSGQMTTDKSNEIKANFKQKQGAANQIADLGYSGQVRQKIINLLPERNALSRKIKKAEQSSLTKPEQDRIAEIDAELAALPRTEAQQAKIDADVEADIAFTEKFGNIGKKDGEFENFIGENKAVVTYNTTKEFMEATGVADGNVDAFITPEGQIIINKQHMREAGAIGVGRHELLHKILKSQFQGDKGKDLAQKFLDILEETDPAGYKLLISRITQKDANGKRIYKDTYLEDNPDEYLTMYASLLAEGKIPLETFVEKPSLVKRLSNFFSNIFSDAANENPEGPSVKPTDIGFKDGKDLYDFVRGYIKDSKSGVLSDRATELAEQGKDIKTTEAQSKTLTPLEAINNLIPAEIQTKKQFDKWVRSESKGGKIIADALRTGGVISNYIKSGKTKQESDKMLDDIVGRIFNFNPEAKRKDGTTVGPEAFGERIFADSAWAKVTARKELFEEGERKKQERSIDSKTMEIADKPTTSKKDDTKLAKKPSETTGFDKATESRIDEAVNKNFKSDDVKFSETRNVPKDVADIYAEKLGINPQTITDKTRNYSKQDAEGLTKAKQLLLKNAKDDYARLPELKDDFGKGTFVPKNVKDALYTDGKLTGSLKDYIDLIREKPVKPIYRDRVGQTIRGLLNLAIRNRILETAQPLQGKRLQSGAKFSKSLVEVGQLSNMQQVLNAIPGENGEMVLNQTTRPGAIIQFLKAIVKGKIPSGVLLLSHMQNFAAERARVGERSQDKRLSKWADKNNIKLNKNSVYYLLTNGNYMEVSKVGKIFPQPTIAEIEKNKFGGKDITLVPAKGGMFYGKKDPNYIEALRLAKENDVLYPDQVQLFKNAKRVKIKDQQRIDKDFVKNNKPQFEDNKKARNAYFDIIYNGLEENNLSLLEASWMLRGAYAATDGIIKISAEFIGTSTEFTLSPNTQAKKDEGKKIKETTEEHSPPASTIGGSILAIMEESIRLKDKSLFENAKKAIDNNFFQTQIAESVDFNLNKNKLGDKIVKGTSILTPNVGWVRLAAGKANLNKIFLPLIEKNAADLLGYSLTKKQGNNQNNVEIQNKEIIDNAVFTDSKFSKSVNRLNIFANNLGDSKLKTGKNNTNIFGLNKINANMTVGEQIKVLDDYDKTLKFSRSLNTKPKGISVFDFDDTLAKTKEKVIVNKADGTTIEISAAKFAEQASELQENGATFNFDNFENVGKGTQKGPLADLALRRQGKFGSKDIFVLTARPQIAATDIKMFLDGIGLNLPLENITGLEDGSPQAKATWVISKTAEGYNDFYFADDAIKNVKAVKEILDQVDVKSKVQQAKYSKSQTFDKIINNILEDSTGIKSEAEFSKARAQTVGAKKGRFSFFVTPSAEDFVGLIYKFLGKGKVGDAQFQFFKDNLIDPYNRAEQAVTRAKISAANDFKALKKSLKTLPKSLSKQTGIGGFTFGQAARVAVWTRQGMEVPGLSKRDAKELNAFIDNNAELDVFVDELINIQKGKPYPAPSQTWLAGNITSDIVNEINKVNRKEYMQEFNENVDIIFSDKVMNKLEAAYGPRYVEALRDQLRRMKSGSNRPIGNSRIVDQLLNWLNNSVGAIMFLNTRSAVLQTISAVNFINFGNNNLIAAGKALLNQKQYWKDFMTLMNSPYLVERRDGLKINVSESEIADAVSESSNKPKAFLNLLLSKGFILTRIADSFAIAAGGSTFYRNQIKAYMKSGMDQAAAEKQAFDDFYAIAEESQQSSNPSKISQQQASGAGRVILAFANTPMQYARIIKRATQDLVNGRGDWKTNVSKIVYYSTIQNLIFNALSNALFALAFSEEDEEKEDKTGRIANGMADSLLRGLGIQGAAVAAVKDALLTIYKQANKEKGAPEFRKAISDLFGFSPPLDSKIRKLTSGANTLSWEREKMSQEGFNLNNPAYLAFAQVLAGLTNVPLDRAIQKINNLRAATSDSSAKWQKVALLMGWSTWDLGLPYYGVEDKVEMTPQMILKEKVTKMKKETNTKQQKETLLELGLTKQQIKALKYEDARVKKIIELQNK